MEVKARYDRTSGNAKTDLMRILLAVTNRLEGARCPLELGNCFNSLGDNFGWYLGHV